MCIRDRHITRYLTVWSDVKLKSFIPAVKLNARTHTSQDVSKLVVVLLLKESSIVAMVVKTNRMSVWISAVCERWQIT